MITYIRMSPVSPYRDGRTYDQISAPLERIGREVLDRLDLRGDETVLDAGCGSGRVTEALVERLPRGTVIGVDGSPEMIAAARRRLGEGPDLLVQDLALLDLGDTTVDAVLSTATFHWIPDHRALFGRLRTVLAPGGRLVAQLGAPVTPPSCWMRSLRWPHKRPSRRTWVDGPDPGISPRRTRPRPCCAKRASAMSRPGSYTDPRPTTSWCPGCA